VFNALVIGGTGLISRAITGQLAARGAEVTVYNRGLAQGALPEGVRQIVGDRTDREAFVRAFEHARYDVVIDMICFSPEQAEDSVRALRGRCEQFIFCSTAATYGPRMPPHVLIDETCPLEPVNHYGLNKVACEQAFRRAADDGAFAITILRPAHTYGPGAAMDDQQESDSGTWDRVVRGLPVLVAGDGLGLWHSTHRDDCARLFAHAALNAKTYGEAYNATGEEILTWRGYYREVARARTSSSSRRDGSCSRPPIASSFSRRSRNSTMPTRRPKPRRTCWSSAPILGSRRARARPSPTRERAAPGATADQTWPTSASSTAPVILASRSRKHKLLMHSRWRASAAT
jgi:nucleoside-diphosphate-sugar epimerase